MRISVSGDVVNIHIKECRRKKVYLWNPSMDRITVRESLFVPDGKATIADETV